MERVAPTSSSISQGQELVAMNMKPRPGTKAEAQAADFKSSKKDPNDLDYEEIETADSVRSSSTNFDDCHYYNNHHCQRLKTDDAFQLASLKKDDQLSKKRPSPTRIAGPTATGDDGEESLHITAKKQIKLEYCNYNVVSSVSSTTSESTNPSNCLNEKMRFLEPSAQCASPVPFHNQVLQVFPPFPFAFVKQEESLAETQPSLEDSSITINQLKLIDSYQISYAKLQLKLQALKEYKISLLEKEHATIKGIEDLQSLLKFYQIEIPGFERFHKMREQHFNDLREEARRFASARFNFVDPSILFDTSSICSSH